MPETQAPQATTVAPPPPMTSSEVLQFLGRAAFSSLAGVKWTYKYHPTKLYHASRRSGQVYVTFCVPLKKGCPRFKKAFLAATRAALELHHRTTTAIAVFNDGHFEERVND